MVLEHSCASRDVNILKAQLQLWSHEEAPCVNAARQHWRSGLAIRHVDWVDMVTNLRRGMIVRYSCFPLSNQASQSI